MSELETIFASAPAAPNAVTNRRVQEAYARAMGKTTAAPPDSRKIPEEEDDCPICYESMFQATEDKLVWCEECGNALHKECFAQCEFTFPSTFSLLLAEWGSLVWIVPYSASFHSSMLTELFLFSRESDFLKIRQRTYLRILQVQMGRCWWVLG